MRRTDFSDKVPLREIVLSLGIAVIQRLTQTIGDQRNIMTFLFESPHHEWNNAIVGGVHLLCSQECNSASSEGFHLVVHNHVFPPAPDQLLNCFERHALGRRVDTGMFADSGTERLPTISREILLATRQRPSDPFRALFFLVQLPPSFALIRL